jgi:glycosyltransferase involved in cell wall biosynthesis
MAEFVCLKPGVVHCWQDGAGIPAAYAAWLVGVPRILISTRNLRPTNFAWYRSYMFSAYCELAECPEVVLINNSRAGAIDYADWLGLEVERFAVKRNGVDLASLRPADPKDLAALRARLGIPPKALIVGSIYRLNEEKRPLLWIQTAREIAKQLPDCHFVIFGKGPLRDELQQLAARSGVADNLHCPGTVADATLGLSLFDIFLLTSRVEGTPNALLEASALGVPVVTTNAGGAREAVVEGVTGYIVDPPEPELIAARVVQIARALNWRERVKTAGPDFVKHCFGLDRMIAETINLYSIPRAE